MYKMWVCLYKFRRRLGPHCNTLQHTATHCNTQQVIQAAAEPSGSTFAPSSAELPKSLARAWTSADAEREAQLLGWHASPRALYASHDMLGYVYICTYIYIYIYICQYILYIFIHIFVMPRERHGYLASTPLYARVCFTRYARVWIYIYTHIYIYMYVSIYCIYIYICIQIFVRPREMLGYRVAKTHRIP